MTATATPTIRAAAPADLDLATEILAAAYLGGDLATWLVPGPAARAKAYPRYGAIATEHALTHGHLDLVDDVAVALWYELGGTEQAGIRDYDRRLVQAVGPRYLPRFAALDTALGVHHPAGAGTHHYLAGLAVRPGLHGHGYGTILLRHRLKILDAAGVPSYLVATGERAMTLFRRYRYVGRPPFAVDGDSSPLLFPMWRDAPSPRPAHHTP